jgi:thioredoxin
MGTNHGILELVDADFAEEVEQGQGVTVVDFWAPWCGPCRMVAPIIEELAETYEGRVRFAKLNVDDAPETAARYGIRSIPTIGIFRDGRPWAVWWGSCRRPASERSSTSTLSPMTPRGEVTSARLPVMGWLTSYRREDLSGDLAAGLTVAVMLIPQGMAYAMLAGLPPVVGLYASTIPLIVYALAGSSRQLAVGPVAIVSLLTLSGVSALAEPGSAQFVALAALLAFMSGVIQLGLGLLRAGFVVNFLSHAVISGFTSAAAIVIGLSQLKPLWAWTWSPGTRCSGFCGRR